MKEVSRIGKIRRFIYFCFLSIAVYSLLLNPAFTFLGGLHTAMLLWPLSIFILHKSIIKGCEKIRGALICWLIIFVYIILRTLLGGDLSYVLTWISFFIELLLVSYVLVRIAILRNINLESVFLVVASLAGIISCVCLFSPDYNTLTKSIQVNTNEYLEQYSYRGFGIGDGLSFTYGVVLGSICALGISVIESHKWFAFFIPIVALAVMINARIGIIPIGLSFVFLILKSKNRWKYLSYTMIVAIAVVFIWINYMEEMIPGATLNWVLKFFTEMGEGSKGDTMQVLLDTTIFPNGFEEWFLGKGYNVFFGTTSKRTDIGYLIQLCYGGIIYCVLLWILVWKIIKPAYRGMPKILFWTLILSMFIENFKGDFVGRNSAFCCFVMMMMYYAQLSLSNRNKVVVTNRISNSNKKTINYE